MRSGYLPLLCLLLASCAKDARTADAPAAGHSPLPPAARDAQPSPPLSRLDLLPPPPSVLINAGSLPLVQLFDQGGRVRILNVTAKQTLLAAQVPPHSIISVTDSGILIAHQRKLTTPLNPAHRFEIWWDQPGR
jgi:hypothetical protein